MAHWFRKKNAKGIPRYVCVHYYDQQSRKQVPLPRTQVKHLDHLHDHDIEEWLYNWEVRRGMIPESAVFRPRDAKLEDLVDDFAVLLKFKKRSPKTIHDHVYCLKTFGLPYFLGLDEPRNNPNDWPTVSIGLLKHLQDNGVSASNIRRVSVSLRLFFHFLGEEGVVSSNLHLRLRNPPRERRTTPLQYALTPEQVLVFAQGIFEPQMKLMALIGYFFSLRTQELMALRPADFLAGSKAEELECCKVFKRFNLFGKFAVNIHRQRVATGGFTEPKSGSKGLVACFNETAARVIVAELKKLNRETLLFPFLPDTNIRKWSAGGINKISLKDLRRASLYYLGHYTSVEAVTLKNHARHNNLATTMLYLRRPEEAMTEGDNWDLDA